MTKAQLVEENEQLAGQVADLRVELGVWKQRAQDNLVTAGRIQQQWTADSDSHYIRYVRLSGKFRIAVGAAVALGITTVGFLICAVLAAPQ